MSFFFTKIKNIGKKVHFSKLTIKKPKMKYFYNFLFVLFVFILLYSCNKSNETEVTYLKLDNNWEFKQLDSGEWKIATVPGNIYSDLYSDTLIENPLYRDNAATLLWVAEKKWEYRNKFSVNYKFLKNKNIFLVFEGIDTYADIYLNDSLILSADNMFVEWKIDCKELLKFGENELLIKFSLKTDEFSDFNDSTLIPYRKSAIQYGLNLAPKLISCGIWKPVYFIGYENFLIETVDFSQTGLTDSLAKISVNFIINSSKSLETTLITKISDSLQFADTFKIEKGQNFLSQEIVIEKPLLWYPNGLGAQNLYNFNFDFYFKDKIIATDQLSIGLRNLEFNSDSLVNTNGLKINGIPVFIKGANYCSTLVFGDAFSYVSPEKLVSSAQKSNINMLKVSGSGIYETDDFYNLCDKAGILVMQDIPLNYSEIYNTDEFKEKITNELKQNISRLKNHPSLVFWCFDPKSHNQVITEIDNFLKNIITENSSKNFYISNIDSSDITEKYPFEVFEQNNNIVFNLGISAFPTFKSLEKFTIPSDLNFNLDVLKTIYYFKNDYSSMKQLMNDYYKIPSTYDKVVYISQLIQAEQIYKFILNDRIAEEKSAGVIYSNLNDYCPSVSFSGIDYFGEWKALQFFIKKAYNNYLITTLDENNSLKVFLTSDKNIDEEVDVIIRVSDFYGKSVWKQRETVTLNANSTENYLSFTKSKITRNKTPNSIVLKIKVVKDAETLVETFYYFVDSYDLNLIKPNITKDVLKIENGYVVELKTDYLAKDVYITSIIDGKFEDNYFDILPGESKFVKFETVNEIIDFQKNFQVITLFEILND
jgi:beta-mannosidase